MSGWDLFGWCMAIGVGVPVALFGAVFALALVLALPLGLWIDRKATRMKAGEPNE